MTALPSDVTLRLEVPHRSPVRLQALAVRRGHVPYGIKAMCSAARFDGDATVLTFSGLLLSNAAPGTDPAGMLADLLMGVLHRKADGRPGCLLMADFEDTVTGTPLPNAPVSRIYLSSGQAVLFEHVRVVVTHPLTPHLQVNPLEREAVTDLLAKDIRDALRVHGSNGTAGAWPVDAFLAEYLVQHGAWRDVNFDATLARPCSEWDGAPAARP